MYAKSEVMNTIAKDDCHIQEDVLDANTIKQYSWEYIWQTQIFDSSCIPYSIQDFYEKERDVFIRVISWVWTEVENLLGIQKKDSDCNEKLW